MQQSEGMAAQQLGHLGNRKRVETVVEALATLHSPGESLSEVAHDARNMVTALGLYCDLIEEPGVLAPGFTHYGNELRLVAAASRRLVEKLVALDAQSSARWAEPSTPERLSATGTAAPPDANSRQETAQNYDRRRRLDMLPSVPIANLAAELLANRNLLSALAGPSIGLTLDTEGGAQPVRLNGEDLTRVLVNLVKNAAEAMPGGGRIHIALSENAALQGAATQVLLTIEDSGPGIPAASLDTIFTPGYTTRAKSGAAQGEWPLSHRGLGLAIVRSIIETAGGRITAANREQGGARFAIELPVHEHRL
jgi:signal transduction histidine kinase